MALPPKLCPRCAEEYVHSAERCIHCDVALVHADALPAPTAGEDLPPVSELESIRVASAGWALALSERLVEEGIPHRVEPATEDRASRAGMAYGVYVRPVDAERARSLDGEQLAREIPDLPEGWANAAPADEGCPACGTEVPEGAAECPDCGLALA